MRRAHVWAHREQESPVVWIRFHPRGAVEGWGLGRAQVRRVRLLRHRVGDQARADGGDTRAPEGAGPRALRLSDAAADGSDRDPYGQGEGRPGLTFAAFDWTPRAAGSPAAALEAVR